MLFFNLDELLWSSAEDHLERQTGRRIPPCEKKRKFSIEHLPLYYNAYLDYKISEETIALGIITRATQWLPFLRDKETREYLDPQITKWNALSWFYSQSAVSDSLKRGVMIANEFYEDAVRRYTVPPDHFTKVPEDLPHSPYVTHALRATSFLSRMFDMRKEETDAFFRELGIDPEKGKIVCQLGALFHDVTEELEKKYKNDPELLEEKIRIFQHRVREEFISELGGKGVDLVFRIVDECTRKEEPVVLRNPNEAALATLRCLKFDLKTSRAHERGYTRCVMAYMLNQAELSEKQWDEVEKELGKKEFKKVKKFMQREKKGEFTRRLKALQKFEYAFTFSSLENKHPLSIIVKLFDCGANMERTVEEHKLLERLRREALDEGLYGKLRSVLKPKKKTDEEIQKSIERFVYDKALTGFIAMGRDANPIIDQGVEAIQKDIDVYHKYQTERSLLGPFIRFLSPYTYLTKGNVRENGQHPSSR